MKLIGLALGLLLLLLAALEIVSTRAARGEEELAKDPRHAQELVWHGAGEHLTGLGCHGD